MASLSLQSFRTLCLFFLLFQAELPLAFAEMDNVGPTPHAVLEEFSHIAHRYLQTIDSTLPREEAQAARKEFKELEHLIQMKQNSVFDFEKHCQLQNQLISAYLNFLNAWHQKLCAANAHGQCWHPPLDNFKFVILDQESWYFAPHNVTLRQQDFFSSEVNFERVTYQLSPFSLCHQAQLEFTNLRSFFNKDLSKFQSWINKQFVPEVLALKTKNMSVKDFYSFLQQNYYYDYYFQEILNFVHDDIIHVSLRYYEYTGGAHGTSSWFNQNYDMDSNRPITLDMVFDETQLPELLKKASSKFIQEKNLDLNLPLKDQGFWFSPDSPPQHGKKWMSEDGFYLPDNFAIQAQGITFYYQLYEIAPYSFGIVYFTLTWEELKPYLSKAILDLIKIS